MRRHPTNVWNNDRVFSWFFMRNLYKTMSLINFVTEFNASGSKNRSRIKKVNLKEQEGTYG